LANQEEQPISNHIECIFEQVKLSYAIHQLTIGQLTYCSRRSGLSLSNEAANF